MEYFTKVFYEVLKRSAGIFYKGILWNILQRSALENFTKYTMEYFTKVFYEVLKRSAMKYFTKVCYGIFYKDLLRNILQRSAME